MGGLHSAIEDDSIDRETGFRKSSSSSTPEFHSTHKNDDTSTIDSDSSEEIIAPGRRCTKPPLRELVSPIQDRSKHLYPCSVDSTWCRPLPISDEQDVLDAFTAATDLFRQSPAEPDDYDYYTLNDFKIYKSDNASDYPGQMVTLDEVSLNRGDARVFLLDGILEHDGVRRYIEEARVERVVIEGFEDGSESDADRKQYHSTENLLFVQTQEAKYMEGRRCAKVWYRLGDPAPEYESYFENYVWVADLAKHMVDYLAATSKLGVMVHLEHFREDFLLCLLKWHGGQTSFQKWHQRFGNQSDFRRAVIQHARFLCGQAESLDEERLQPLNMSHPLWAEMPFRRDQHHAIPRRAENIAFRDKALITPFIKQFFMNMEWAKYMGSKEADPIVGQMQEGRKKENGFHSEETPLAAMSTREVVEEVGLKDCRVKDRLEGITGTFVVVRKNQLGNTHPDFDIGFVYVHEIVCSRSRPFLKVIDVLQLSDTVLARAQGPFSNELYMSNRCSCDATSPKIRPKDVMAKVNVATFSCTARANDSALLFMRYTYDEKTQSFCVLQKSDFKCGCVRPREPDSKTACTSRKGSQ